MPPKKRAPHKIKSSSRTAIQVRGARQHNLKGFDVDIPLGQLTVITGPSGSGKSSLAFHTLYAEGQRRYVETFSPYVRQFFDRMDKPLVDKIENIPPAIAIEQKNQIRTTRSTVGTLTEINDYLKLLYPRLATARHPSTGEPLRPDTPATATRWTLEHFLDQQVFITFPVPIPSDTRSVELFSFLQKQGYLRILLTDGSVARTDEPSPQATNHSSHINVIQDRLTVTNKTKSRLFESLETALRLGKGSATVAAASSAGSSKIKIFSTSWHPLREPTSALFTFNNPLGACPNCRGFGRVIGIDLYKAIPDHSLSIADGCVKPFQGERGEDCQAALIRFAHESGINLHIPFGDLSPQEQEWILYGESQLKNTEELWQAGEWYGVRGYFDWLESKAYKMHVRVFLARYRTYTDCPACRGRRLCPEALAFSINGKTLPDLWRLPIHELAEFIANLKSEISHYPSDKTLDLIITEISARLQYLREVGLSYLTLDRPARTLSGGEIARVNLTTCLGTSLSQTLFVLDEPTVGLHPRDIDALTNIMHRLRDKGNTLLVVEHDEAVMRQADHLLDIGPASGQEGGHLVYSGPVPVPSAPQPLIAPPTAHPPTAKKISKLKTQNSIPSSTLAYLSGQKTIPTPTSRRQADTFLHLTGATANNIRNLDLALPLGVFTCLTGVSGSGKSTLAHNLLYLNLARQLGQEIEDEPARLKSLHFPPKSLTSVQLVDQSPLAKTPKSTPAVYLGAFELIRQLFALTPEAKAASLTPGYFSFNSGEGRCERCWGNGFEKVEMQFLSDLYLTCPECNGNRYHATALTYNYEGYSISDLLNLTIAEFVSLQTTLQSSQEPKPKKEVTLLEKASTLLHPLLDVGLGYLKLGQPLNTLSGGESQRLKLCQLLHQSEISNLKSHTPKTSLLILDEPTTGLHFSDIEKLLTVLHRLVDSGHTLLVIEHNLDVIKSADHLIDLGPDAGISGGQIVAQGTPEEVAKSHTLTGKFLKAHLAGKTKTPKARAGINREKSSNTISIHGARHHNLKNISLEIPRDQLVVVTGLSGSGKSTLAFDIVFAEGQRRFLDSMSPYARQFAEQLEKPDVDKISGLPPTVAIEQRVSRGGGKSTVATITELYHFLRLLFAKLGTQHCPVSLLPVVAQTEDSILQALFTQAKKGSITLLAPIIRGRKGYHTEVATWAERHGYTKLLVDHQFKETANFQRLERFVEHDIDIVIGEIAAKSSNSSSSKLIAEALKIGKGTLRVIDANKQIKPYSTSRVSLATGQSFEELDPAHFSFNSPRGWCPTCRGYGQISKTHRHYDTRSETPHNSLAEAEIEYDRKLDRAEDEELSTCPACHGSRLNEVARHVFLTNLKSKTPNSSSLSLPALAALPVHTARELIESFHFEGRDALIARDILPELTQRLHFLTEVGLGYLSLDRSANTLSGGEAQRIRLAAQLGSNLRGVLYVLDEPTIGLHPRDNVKLLDTLRALQQKGNSLLIVEHDEETMARADHQIHLGPGAGRHGGELVAADSIKPFATPLPPRRKIPAATSRTGWLRLKGCQANNLKMIDVAIPLARLTVLTGVSGCGKSSLMRGCIGPAAVQTSKNSRSNLPFKSASGFDQIKSTFEVDQTPIGKTSRSCPATYVKLFDEIRKLFALLPEARARGFNAGRFSFNNSEGQCPECKGNGRIKLEMDFLPPTWIDCEACNGARYNPATLEVTYDGYSIGDILLMTIAEAADFFSPVPKLNKTLQLLADTGLGYLQLGQPSPTLSGGEAQRIKLVSQLIKGRSPKAQLTNFNSPLQNLYLIEEPSIGLHHEDVAKLIDVLHRLVNEGHTVIVIEHHMDLAAQADYLLDLGPEAGAKGGTIVAQGTPEQVAQSKISRTAPFLKSCLSPQPNHRLLHRSRGLTQ